MSVVRCKIRYPVKLFGKGISFKYIRDSLFRVDHPIPLYAITMNLHEILAFTQLSSKKILFLRASSEAICDYAKKESKKYIFINKSHFSFCCSVFQNVTA